MRLDKKLFIKDFTAGYLNYTTRRAYLKQLRIYFLENIYQKSVYRSFELYKLKKC